MHLPIYKELKFLSLTDIDAIVSENYKPDLHDTSGKVVDIGVVITTVFFKSGQILRFLCGRDKLSMYIKEMEIDKS